MSPTKLTKERIVTGGLGSYATQVHESGLLPPLLVELALRVGQGLRLDQQALPLVAAAALAEAHHDGMSRALRLGPAREQRVSGGEELEIVETDAAQARRPGFFHDEKIAGAAAAVAGPLGVQRQDHHQVRRTARLLRQALPPLLGKPGRNPMGAIELLDRGVAAAAEAQRLPLRRARDIVRLARGQPLCDRPGSKQLHGLRYARRMGLERLLEAFDLPLPPASRRSAVEPTNADEHAERADVVLSCERRLRRPGHPIGKRPAILPAHGRMLASDMGDQTCRSVSRRGFSGRTSFPIARNSPPAAERACDSIVR